MRKFRNLKTNNNYILGLDPSSTVCGFAVKDDLRLVEAGLLIPDKNQQSFFRIRQMRLDLIILLEKFRPGIVLVEWTKGKVNISRHKGCGAGLAVYGAGMSGIATQADIWCQENNSMIIPILENVWTRGVVKRARQAAVTSQYREYQTGKDPGGDIADAIGIIDYWQKENLITGNRIQVS